METEERFRALVEEFAECPGVELPDESKARRFGADALKVNGSIFAMVQAGRLVLKLPANVSTPWLPAAWGARSVPGRAAR